MANVKPYPHIEMQGIDDQSAQQIPYEPERLPQHLPAVFLHTELSEEVTIASGSYLTAKYGTEMFNPLSPFYNHQSVLAQLFANASNQMMVVPIKLPDSKKANVRISVEAIPLTVEENGVRRHAIRFIWHTDEIPEGQYGQAMILSNYRAGTTTSVVGNKRLGVLVDETGVEYQTPSTLFPLFDLQVEARGSFGNRIGFIIDAPNSRDPQPTDANLANRLQSFIYRLSFVQRARTGITYNYLRTNTGMISADFVLKPNTVDSRTNLEMFFADVMNRSYTTVTDPSVPPLLAPFNKPIIYNSNIETVHGLIAGDQTVVASKLTGNGTKEFIIKGVYSDPEEAIKKAYTINIVTGKDYGNNPYPNLVMTDSFMFDGISFGKESTIFARGGSDGFPMTQAGSVDTLKTLQLYDEQVRNWCDSFDEYNPLFDMAKYPFSTVWDSGFSIDTKKGLVKVMGSHKRIWVGLATQSVADYADEAKTRFDWMLPNTIEQDTAIGTLLNAVMHLYPESELFGTSTCRGIIVERCGDLKSGLYKGKLPLSLSVAFKIARYCGAGDGYWKPQFAIDSEKGKVDDLFKNVNYTYAPSTEYERAWAEGMIWVQTFDRESNYFPAFQTVYNDSSSILDSLLVIVAACYATRIGDRVHRQVGGNGGFGKLKFLEESDNKLSKELENRFDGRVYFVPESYYTEQDKTRGYTWTTRLHMYADPMNLVNTFSIVAHRRAEEGTTAGG